jgi:hypothetical protein
MNDELKKAAAKIAKCLALAASDNPAEAEAAKRQAEALMKKYNLNGEQVAAAQVSEQHAKTGGKNRPPQYLSRLALIVANAFACEAIASPGWGYKESCMIFIGLGCKPELACYTFDVLRRQLNKDRTAYQATLKRYKRENKIRMADLFCQAWLSRIYKQVREFAGSDQERQAVEAYKAQRWGDSLETDLRAGAKPEKSNDWDAIDKGHQAAQDVSLHKPVQSKRRAMLAQQS